MVQGGLSPLYDREQVLEMIARTPTLLQRDVKAGLAPKLAAVRSFMSDPDAADNMVRAKPRILLSSFGVLGRLAFLKDRLDTVDNR